MRSTPMLEQYWALKREAPDAILLYRLGDFYEMFFEDAETAAPLLGLVLTARHRDSDIEAPMCGIPHHALEGYLARLVAAGKKVAIGEQVEPPGRGKAVVARKIVRVVTPGTWVDAERLDARRPNELAAFARSNGAAALAYLDLSAGDFSVTPLPEAAAREQLARRTPRELLVRAEDEPAVRPWLSSLGSTAPLVSLLGAEAPRGRAATELLKRHFAAETLLPFGISEAGPEADAAASLLHYARSTQKTACAHVASLRREPWEEGLVVDSVTAGHLELFRSLRDGGRAGSLVALLDRTGTAFGARTLRRLLERPLGRRDPIEARLSAVEELLEDPARLSAIARALSAVPDLPRIAGRISVGTGTPRDVAGLAEGILAASRVEPLLSGAQGELLRPGGEAWPGGFPLDVVEEVRRRLVPDPPPTARDGNLVPDGVDPEVDEVRRLRRESASILAGLEAEERAARGIPTLRVKFNQVFGHVFEVPASARAKVPPDALKRQTLATTERYATKALVEVDEKLRTADARLAEREAELFAALVADVVAATPRLLSATAALGLLDALVSLAEVARSHGWCRPALSEEPVLEVTDGRHPVVEALRPREPFVPNDTSLSPESRVVVLTGPNMGGKSTYLRQNALVVLLSHVGSFVPASKATVGLCDRVFTRVGASDSLAQGESTFFVEMAETAHILRQATRRSLVVLDEVGRGTSTFDGLSLAWAIAERLHDGATGEADAPARVLFATHYHELTELALVKPGVRNRTMAVREWRGEVVFLRKVVEGAADRSYGVQVARLAGIPEPVLSRAREILHNLERQQLDVGGRPRLAEHPNEPVPSGAQLDLFQAASDVVLDTLARLEIDQLTPLAALNVLAALQDRLRGDG